MADEAAEALMLGGAPTPVPGREDALDVATWGPPADVLGLRTAVAAFLVLRFDVPRPKSLTSGDHLSRIVDAMYTSLRTGSSSTFRFEAAGSDSAVFSRLAELLAEATGLRYDEKEGAGRPRPPGCAPRTVRRPRLGRARRPRRAAAVRPPLARDGLPRCGQRNDHRC